MARASKLIEPILTLLAGSTRHAWSLEDIRQDLRTRDLTPDFSSIFRVVEQLVAQGRVNRIHLADAPPRFELSGAHHDHLHCTLCDLLVPVPCLAPHNLADQAAQAQGFALHAHNIVLDGVCPHCQLQRQPRPELPA
ncbi:MAG: transcriptional repressor [Hyphomicrobiales bacterium]|nr:transcriptional repressor [Hyphomicrobiales bacterium]MDE2114055.1 transcriptional repressor [Hyphomicrobiales bacterium]